MNSKKHIEIKNVIGEKDERSINFVLNKLVSMNYFIRPMLPVTPAEKYHAMIVTIDSLDFDSPGHKNAFINNLLESLKNNLLPKSEIDWIDKKDKRLCHWLWFHLHEKYNMPASGNYKNETARYNEIIYFFDNLQNHNIDKITLMNALKIDWKECRNYKGYNYEWLNPKNDNQLTNVWRYLQTNSKKNPLPRPLVVNSLYCKNLYAAILASIDIWQEDFTVKETFASNMDRAFKAKDIRAKKSNKQKSQTLKLNKKTLDLLDKLTIDLGQTDHINVITQLINEKYDLINNKKQEAHTTTESELPVIDSKKIKKDTDKLSPVCNEENRKHKPKLSSFPRKKRNFVKLSSIKP